jgi:catechol 2,3-dioxygenase-like lactoylglutathione lyase family enzyme
MIPIRSLVPFVHVRDVAASIEFYEKLGFAVHNTLTPDGAGAPVWAWLQCDDAQLMLARADAPVVAGEQAVMFYLYVDDVDAKHAELRAAGVAAGDIRIEFYAPRGEFRVTDPDGYTLMVTHTGP